MAKKTSKRSKSSSRKKSSSNVFTKILIILFALILVTFFIVKYAPKSCSNKEQNTESQLVNNVDGKAESQSSASSSSVKERENKNQEKTNVAKCIEGCWMSTTGGAVLTMKNYEYRIDFMGVDIGKPIIGMYIVENEIITFTTTEEPYKGEKGIYEVNFDKHEISFKCKTEECTKRRATLVTDWEWLEE